MSEFFRIRPAIKRAAKGGMAAIPAWWPGNPTPGLITIGGDLFVRMRQELPDDPKMGGWRVAALFALAHEFAHSACFAYPNSVGQLKNFPLCFFELVADFCAGAFLQHLVLAQLYNRLDTDSVVRYFEARSYSGGNSPTRPDWHGSPQMRLTAVAMGRNAIKSSPQLGGLAILRLGVATVIREFDTQELRQKFSCAGILWGVPELEDAAAWLVKERKE
ncbi:MAG: hypothetical protein KDK08_20515 [Rhizobiaceae bacterium]|nr:hypothetical protein [Rhizobiaceae bacterium]